jgi:hypothetical protein
VETATPDIPKGQDARVSLVRHRQALAQCIAQSADIRNFYNRLRLGAANPKETTP